MAITPNSAAPAIMPSNPPSGPPYAAPSVTKGAVPKVARPQLKTVERIGKPRLLKAAFDTKIMPRNSQIAGPHAQKKVTRRSVSPLALNMATMPGVASHSTTQTTRV